jgi:hypothetical protein
MAPPRSAELLPACSGAPLATVIRRAGRCSAAFAALAVLAMRTEDGWVSRIDQRTISALPHGRHPAGIAMAQAVSALAERDFVFALLAAQAIQQARRAGRPWPDKATITRPDSRILVRAGRPRASLVCLEPRGGSGAAVVRWQQARRRGSPSRAARLPTVPT